MVFIYLRIKPNNAMTQKATFKPFIADSSIQSRRYFIRVGLLLLMLFLGACAGPTPTTIEPEKKTLPIAEQVQRLLNEAKTIASPQKEQNQLRAAKILLNEQQVRLAAQIIENVPRDPLPLSDLASYTDILSRIHIRLGKFEDALQVLDNKRLVKDFDSLSQRKQINISLLRAEVYALLGNHMASAQQRIFLAPLLNKEQQASSQKLIWRSLMYISNTDLTLYRDNAFSHEYRGWLELALIAKNQQSDLDKQLLQLEDWQKRWLNHPANKTLPGGLELIKELAANRPQRVALLLPLTGPLAPFGKAVRDGFIAAMYESRDGGGTVPKIKVYNTGETENIVAMYQTATTEGAELIVGPLEKHRVKQLFDTELLVPTLALNRVDDYGPPPPQLYQFGLDPKDEAQQIATIAILENHKKALVIAPEGEWGERVSEAFTDRWQELGGKLVSKSIYSGQKDYSTSIKKSLLLDKSEQRAKRVAKLVDEHLEFSPRRREDIDMFFLLAHPQHARSIAPLLDYHYAGDIPIYGTSRLYAGYDDLQKDRDLNGIKFTDMPWILEKPTALHKTIEAENTTSKLYQRMYALGIDSFQLHARLRQLKEISSSRVFGETGSLKLNDKQQIERQTMLAKIKNSKAEIIPIVEQSSSE